MDPQAGTELYWLFMTVVMTGLMWVPYIVNRLLETGFAAALWDPRGHTAARAGWANRMMSAHANAVENLVVFAPLVLLVELTHSANGYTAAAVQVYFFARLAHYLVFTFAVPVLRVVSFLAGFGAQLVLALQLL